MATIYKRGNIWYASFTAPDGNRCLRSTRTGDRRQARKMAEAWEHRSMEERQGLADRNTDDLLKEESRGIKHHLREYELDLKAQGRSSKHAQDMVRRVEKVCVYFKIERSRDITPAMILRFMSHQRSMGRSARTANAYGIASKAFGAWLERTGRARRNDLRHVRIERTREQSDRRLRRRALEEQELAALIQAADKSSRKCKIDGPDRALMYMVASGTGLRAAEIGSLTRESFQWDHEPPTVTVEAMYSKRRRMDTLPIHTDLAMILKERFYSTPRGVKLFHIPWRLAEVMRSDLAEARQAWILGSDDKDERRIRSMSTFCMPEVEGKRVDFHGLRHTFITRLVMSGLPVKVVQELARHSDPKLTLGIYSHVGLTDLAKAVPGIPRMTKDEATDGEIDTR